MSTKRCDAGLRRFQADPAPRSRRGALVARSAHQNSTVSRSNTMNGCQSSTESYSERQYNLQCVSDFHAVLLGMAAHDLRQPLQVIQSTYKWLAGRFDAEADKARLQRGQRGGHQ